MEPRLYWLGHLKIAWSAVTSPVHPVLTRHTSLGTTCWICIGPIMRTSVMSEMVYCGTGELLFLVFMLASGLTLAMTGGEFDSWWDSWRTSFDLKWPEDFCKGYPYYTNCMRTRPERLKTKLSIDVQRLSAASNPGTSHNLFHWRKTFVFHFQLCHFLRFLTFLFCRRFFLF